MKYGGQWTTISRWRKQKVPGTRERIMGNVDGADGASGIHGWVAAMDETHAASSHIAEFDPQVKQRQGCC